MKRNLHIKLLGTFALVLCLLGSITAQENTIHVGERFVIKDSTHIYILGNFTDSVNGNPNINYPVTNLGKAYIQGNLYNQGDKNVFGIVNGTRGTVIMNGTSGREISGNDSINFHNLYVDLGVGNELENKSYIFVNDSLYLINGRILLSDSISLYNSAAGSDATSGIHNETNENRIHGPQIIRLDNYIWGTANTYTYQNFKNIGISYKVNDYLGSTASVIRRAQISQDCGPSTNSVERTFNFLDIPNTGAVENVSIKWHNDFELGNNLTGDSMHVYKSGNDGDSWEDIEGDYSVMGVVTDAPVVHNISNYTIYTVAKDSCDVLPNAQIGQIITATTPHDTLFNLTDAMSCDPINPDAQLLAFGDTSSLYTWTYPDSSKHVGQFGVSITPGVLGQYVLSVQDTRGCINYDTINVIQAPAANADFSVSGAGYCANTLVPFIPTENSQSGYTYEWDFGDSSNISLYNPDHTFTNEGTYEINLRVTTDQGCIDGHVEYLVIHPIPTASFSSVSACPGEPLTLVNSTLGTPGQPVNLIWDIYDDNTIEDTTLGNGNGTGGNYSFAFPSSGTYSVSLVAESNGCSSTEVVQSVLVYPTPNVNFSYTNACEGQAVDFTNLVTISSGSITDYNWNFGDINGTTTTLSDPSFTYNNNGGYEVTLTATSDHSCVISYADTVTIDENPIVSFSTTDVCVNNVASFGAVSSVPGTGWVWSFGDGNTGNTDTTSNTYTTDGTYNVSLTLTSAKGCVGSASNDIVIFPGPTVGYTALNGCIGSSIAFQNTTTNGVSYAWDFPSLGQTSTNFHENRIFNTAGFQTAKLTATSSNGCSSTYVDSVEIYPLPTINLGGPNIATCGTSYTLDANPGGVNNGGSFFWTTGATTPQFNATYNGNFGVTVTSANGCVASDNADVTLNTAVVPNLGNDRTVCDQETLDCGYSGATYLWNTGATSQSIVVTTSGTYSVDVTDQNGCVGTNSVVITVTTSDPVNLGLNQQTACQGEIISLDAGNPGDTYLWSTGATSQTINVTQDGYYSVEVTNTAGCVSGDTVNTVFYSAPTVSLGNDGAYCVENSYNVFTSNASYMWSDGSSNPGLTVNASGTYWVDVTDLSTTCTTRDSVDVIINPLPVVQLGNDTVLCSYDDITLDAGNPGASYLWNNGALSQTTTVFTTGTYSVEVTDANGCANDDQINITLNPLFTFDLGPDRPYCKGSVIILDPGITSTVQSYDWFNDSVQLATTPTFVVPDTGVIHLDVIDQFGCLATDSITILPSSLSLYAVYLADSKVAAGDTIKFVNLSYPKPYDSYWDFDNGATSTDSMPEYTYFVPGDYDVTLTVDNGNCVSELTKTITVDPVKIVQPEVPTYGSVYTSILEMLIYPNPNNGQFNLKLKLESESAVELAVFNMLGQLIHLETFETEESIRQINLERIKPGMYFVRARVGKEIRTEKFIKIYSE